jgi:hypothetical protein
MSNKSPHEKNPIEVLEKEVDRYQIFRDKIKNRDGISPDADQKKLDNLWAELGLKMIEFEVAIAVLRQVESPARYSEEEVIGFGEYYYQRICRDKSHEKLTKKELFAEYIQPLPSNAETVEKKFCKHNGVKRIGESCMRNNKCEYPKCLVSAPVDETDYLLSTKANRERLEESINQERAMEYANEQGINYPIDTTYQSMIKSQIQSAYLAGFTASKDYAKGLLEDVSKKIIGKLNSYCLSQDNKRLGLPVLDEVAMLEMTEIVCKLLNQLK